MDGQEYYTTKSIAKLFKCHENTILKWIKDGKLPAFRIGRGWRIKQCDLDNFTKPQNIKPINPREKAHKG